MVASAAPSPRFPGHPPPTSRQLIEFVADPSGRTFLFLLSGNHGPAVKLRLKFGASGRALNVSRPLWGPAFGSGPDLHLPSPTGKLKADGRPGCSCVVQPASFEVDRMAGAAEGGLGSSPLDFDFASNPALLGGGRADANMGARVFDAVEIIVYELKEQQ